MFIVVTNRIMITIKECIPSNPRASSGAWTTTSFIIIIINIK